MNDKCVMISAGGLGMGGVRTHLRLLCRELRRSDIGVVLFGTSSSWPDESMEELLASGVQCILPANPRSCSRLESIFSMLRWPVKVRRNASSLYCIGAGNSHFLLRRLAGRGVISIYHEVVSPPYVKSLAGRCVSQLDATVGNSRAIAKTMSENWPSKPMRVIPFLTSDQALEPPAERPAVGNRELRIAYLGRLAPQKRAAELVRDWASISALPALHPARLDVYGDEPGEQTLGELRSFVSQNGLSDRVTLHGSYDTSELPAILEKTDAVVLPSQWEGLPLVLVEAMLRGVPIASTNAGGTAELGEDNPDVVVTGTDWDDFVSGLSTLAAKIRVGGINAKRLHQWTESRYGHVAVSNLWIQCLLQPREFFA
jgi:glycosyltransferase involved in cell wall biosynthesis